MNTCYLATTGLESTQTIVTACVQQTSVMSCHD